MHAFNPTKAAIAAVAFLSAFPVAQADGLYPKSSSVLQVDARSYDKLIAKSNHTSIVEFYAPWCGHCKNLQPAYEKAAKHLEGIAKVAAVNCDDDANKQFCGAMGVQGFPTLKTVRPGKSKGGKPVVEDYNGPRNAKGIVDAVSDKINNHVKRVTDKELDSFLETDADKPKAILFTEKGTTSPTLRSVAIDFLDVIQVAQIRSKESKAVEKFDIDSFPTLILLPGDGKDPVVYDGDMKKPGMVKFLSQAGEPNPDPPKSKSKAKKDEGNKKSDKTETPPAAAEEKAAPPAPALNVVSDVGILVKQCLAPKSGTCVLALVPTEHTEEADKTIRSLVEVKSKNPTGSIPFYEVPNDQAIGTMAKSLGVTGEIEVIAVNGKRGWWRRYSGAEHNVAGFQNWIDDIRMNEGPKEKLPEALLKYLNAAGGDETPEHNEL